ncbi:glucose-6-phosphate isomerase [Nitrosopumilus sp.]|jgi:glucose/mannose-6-phosphate isomerase|nr:glucose-6-phosphate isomerase [Nitrosopumilus sp.]
MYETYDLWPEIAIKAYETKFKKLDIKNIDHVVFVGNGGSGSIGDIIGSILSKKAIHVTKVRGYLLPKTINSNTLVIATSVSGNTSEVLSVLKSLKDTSANMISFSSGGLMEKYCNNNNIRYQKISKIHSPRASFTNFLYSILNILEPILPIENTDIRESISVLEKTKQNIFSGNLNQENQALELSKFIKDVICIYYPAGLQAAAIRYKNSLQENTKIHAMVEDVIETCHNGIVAWEKKSNVRPILIQGKNDHIKTSERWDILKEYFSSKNIDYRFVESVNGSILTKIINLSYLLDYSSIYASVLNKIDPTPVQSIEDIKKKIAVK